MKYSVKNIEDNIYKHNTELLRDDIFVDPLMKDILIVLNNKGYETSFSCQSHGDETVMLDKSKCYLSDMYISFDKLYFLKCPPDGFSFEYITGRKEIKDEKFCINTKLTVKNQEDHAFRRYKLQSK